MRLLQSVAFAALLYSAASLPAHDAPPGAASSLSPLASEAAAAVDAFHTALRRGDTNAAAALVADDALIFESGGVERSKAEYSAHHLRADAEFAKSMSSTVTRRVGSADGAIAWIATDGRTKGIYKGRPIDSATTETMVLRRVGATWKIEHIHWSSGKP